MRKQGLIPSMEFPCENKNMRRNFFTKNSNFLVSLQKGKQASAVARKRIKDLL